SILAIPIDTFLLFNEFVQSLPSPFINSIRSFLSNRPTFSIFCGRASHSDLEPCIFQLSSRGSLLGSSTGTLTTFHLRRSLIVIFVGNKRTYPSSFEYPPKHTVVRLSSDNASGPVRPSTTKSEIVFVVPISILDLV